MGARRFYHCANGRWDCCGRVRNRDALCSYSSFPDHFPYRRVCPNRRRLPRSRTRPSSARIGSGSRGRPPSDGVVHAAPPWWMAAASCRYIPVASSLLYIIIYTPLSRASYYAQVFFSHRSVPMPWALTPIYTLLYFPTWDIRLFINAREIRLARYYDGGKLEVRCVAEIKVTTRKHFSVGTGFGTHITLYRKKDTKSRVLFING